ALRPGRAVSAGRPGRASRTEVALRTLNAGVALVALRPGRAGLPGPAGRASRTSVALRAGGCLKLSDVRPPGARPGMQRASVGGDVARPGIAGVEARERVHVRDGPGDRDRSAVRAVSAGGPGGAGAALRAGGPLRTLRAGRAVSAGVTLRSLRS